MRDMRGVTIKLGDKVARAVKHGSSAAIIEIRKVTKITMNELFLDDSHVSIKYPERLLVIDL